MEINWCKIIGHKDRLCYVKGEYNGKTVKFITWECTRCLAGILATHNIIEAGNNVEYGTYNEKYSK